MLSIILNTLNAFLIIGAVLYALLKTEEKSMIFRYFTVLSNLLCAAASLICAFSHALGSFSFAASVLKYVGTCAVTVTMLTVILFLAPLTGSIKELTKGRDLLLHLVCPVLAVITYLLFDKIKMGPAYIFSGVLPVLFYGSFYLYKVVFAPEDRRWEDFYMFNKTGRWPVSFAAMVAGSLIISFILWIV